MNLDLEKPFTIFENEYVSIGLALFLALYGVALSRAKLPDYVLNLFKSTAFRIAFLSLLLINNFDNTPHISIAVAVVFILTMDYLAKREIEEEVEQEYFRTL